MNMHGIFDVGAHDCSITPAAGADSRGRTVHEPKLLPPIPDPTPSLPKDGNYRRLAACLGMAITHDLHQSKIYYLLREE